MATALTRIMNGELILLTQIDDETGEVVASHLTKSLIDPPTASWLLKFADRDVDGWIDIDMLTDNVPWE